MEPGDPSPSGAFKVLIDRLFDELGSALRDAGWSVQREPSGGPPGYSADFLFRRGALKYVAELRVARVARRPELPALFADAFLRAKVGADAHRARPLAIVGAPSISNAWAKALAEHAERFFPGQAWGFIDGEGRLQLHGKGLDDIRRSAAPQSPRGAGAESSADAFSDLGQWLSKVVLAPSLPPDLLHGPRERASGPRQLAQLANVSVPSASRYLSRLRRLGFLDSMREIHLVRRDKFLIEWQRANRFVGKELPCRFLFRAADPLSRLSKALSNRSEASQGQRACLGLFAACERLELGFVRGGPVHLYLEDASSSLERLELVPVSPGERVEVFVREPMFPESVFRAAVDRGSVPVSDVIQCWLDVADHPVRGQEQAEQLWKRVLEPRLLGEGPQESAQ